ncbi:Oidioi.mRNA.OKI2018_I69.PAR.g9816.t1.cds [Oikopleura dioica]|uniref:Oidioi.mRNA.OKI2018_I69.PAR.g9816.t1.cds n=1 Tax=Oikopleura dioica TaxID=34765 RepID=A0ABN7RQE6_OIKDI|nr:Oidioi.mRNA.OKI2018_I69.PAR.g9816.t1.cds [Oikopleura dioica]
MDSEKRATSREEYKNYLRKTGVWDTLNQFLVKLYETHDKPNDAKAFLAQYIHGDQVSLKETHELRAELDALQAQVADLKIRAETAEAIVRKQEGIEDEPEDNEENPAEPEEEPEEPAQ